MLRDPRWSNNLYAEVVTLDCYRVKDQLAPTTVYDLGANLGCFSAHARNLWPDAHVVAVEPHPTNYETLREVASKLGNMTPIWAALATGPAYWLEAQGGESNPGGQAYICESAGYEAQDLVNRPRADCPSISLDQLVAKHPPRGPYIIKIDTEGAEECLFEHQSSNDVLHGAQYWTAELHFYSARERSGNGSTMLATHGHVIRPCLDWLYGFSTTHVVDIQITFQNSGMAWCSKRPRN